MEPVRQRSTVEQVVDAIGKLADAPDSIVHRVDESTFVWEDGLKRVRLLDAPEHSIGLLQVVEEDGEVASTHGFVFTGLGILSSFFAHIPVAELESGVDYVGRALELDPTCGAVGPDDEANFFKTLLYPLKEANGEAD